MKNQFNQLCSLVILFASFAIGIAYSDGVQHPPAMDTAAPNTGAAAGHTPPTPRAVAEGLPHDQSRYVQEAGGRTSFRPDFSRSLRQTHQRSNFAMLRAFNDAISQARQSTVEVSVGGLQVALGAIVGSDGWIATKASELPREQAVYCRLSDNSEHVAEVVKRDVDFDLAILKIDVSNLPVVIWDKSSIPARGKWLATTDLDRTPSAVGVVSAGAQRVGKAKAVLGVHLIDSSEGAAITMVLPGSGADEAGLQIGDSIYAVEGREVYSRNAFLAAIDGRQGGQPVKLSVNRASRKFDIDARLMDLADELLDETEMEVNGRISARATGFSRVFLHDTVLEPNQCGGPLCNLDGLVVGLNIARAGRVTSYALPADVVQPIIQSMIEQAQLVSRPVEAITTQTIR